MNCEQLQRRLDEYLDGDLDLNTEAGLHAHLDICPACRARLARAEAIQAALKAVRVPPMTPGFAQRAVAEAAARRRSRRHGSIFFTGVGSALVAGFAMLMVVGGLLPGGKDAAPALLTEVAISVAAPKMVNVAFDVSYAMHNATLRIQLPDNIEVIGFPGVKQLSWQTSLAQGRNVLPLPLRANGDSDGEISTTIEHDGKQKSVRIKVKVKKELPPRAELPSPDWV